MVYITIQPYMQYHPSYNFGLMNKRKNNTRKGMIYMHYTVSQN